MTRLMLDSSFVIDHLRGLPAASERWHRLWADGDDPIVTDIIVVEVRVGLRAADSVYLERMLEPMEYIHVGPKQSLIAGEWRAAQKARGRSLSLGDALIGVAAWSEGAAVLTRNVRDFELMPVRVETY